MTEVPGMSLGTFVFLVLAAIGGCPRFEPGGAYNTPVTGAAVDANSAQYIHSMEQAGDTAGFWAAAQPVEYINVARGGTPRTNVRAKVSYHDFPLPYPWRADFRIEPLSDAHAIVIDAAACRLYESYETTYSGGVLSAYSGATWNLREPFRPLPPGEPSSMASGLSLFAGIVTWEEVRTGRVLHALNWAPPAGTVSQYTFVRPASDTGGTPFAGSAPYQLPWGAHLRLKANVDLSHFGPQSRAIAKAMKEYGIFLADTGTKGNAIYTAAAVTGTASWDAADLAALDSLRISDFEVLVLPRTLRVPGH